MLPLKFELAVQFMNLKVIDIYRFFLFFNQSVIFTNFLRFVLAEKNC